MAVKVEGGTGKEEAGKSRKKGVRTTDDLELLRLILDDNPPLKERVLRLIEKHLGVRHPGSTNTQG